MEYIKKLHDIHLEMILEIKRICDLNDINYFLVGGSLIGAVRHNGFIPWDDDVDIGMLREEYEKFVKVCETQLNSKYFLQNRESDSKYGLTFSKLIKKDTVLIEKSTKNVGCKNGVFIDIFPFDNVPNNIILQKIQAYNIYILRRLMLLKSGYDIFPENIGVKYIIYRLVNCISKILSENFIWNKLNNNLKRYNIKLTNEVVNLSGVYGYKKESVPRSWVENTTKLIFEGYEIDCPIKYDEYLTKIYGNYMKLPPEEDRYNRHNIIKFELGD